MSQRLEFTPGRLSIAQHQLTLQTLQSIIFSLRPPSTDDPSPWQPHYVRECVWATSSSMFVWITRPTHRITAEGAVRHQAVRPSVRSVPSCSNTLKASRDLSLLSRPWLPLTTHTTNTVTAIRSQTRPSHSLWKASDGGQRPMFVLSTSASVCTH
jgi:hypothetical protein